MLINRALKVLAFVAWNAVYIPLAVKAMAYVPERMHHTVPVLFVMGWTLWHLFYTEIIIKGLTNASHKQGLQKRSPH